MSSAAAGDAAVCPLCGSTQFLPIKQRELARCARCRAVERTRLLWLVMNGLGLFGRRIRVLHVAPEGALMKRFSEAMGEDYHAFDLFPERCSTRFTTVRKLDICTDLVGLPSNSYDLG